MKMKLISMFIILLINSSITYGFTFNAIPTAETCAGNGSISFISNNTNPNGTIIYFVYKLPNVSTPYATVSGSIINNVSAGTYKIIARETVGNTITEKQKQVTVLSNIIPLKFSIVSLNQACSNTSNISVNTITGTAVSYEIFSGPILYPLQTSNTFTGLIVGVYKIRVFNACGIGVVKTFTVTQNTAGITIGPPVLTDTTPVSCDFSVVTNTLSAAPGTVMGYPLVITYTIHPPGGGAPIVINTSLSTGSPTSQDISEIFPNYINQTYNYDITIVDACNSTYTHNFIVTQNIDFTPTIVKLDCNQNYFYIDVINGTAPYTLNFTAFPAGFNPINYNVDYPGLFNTNNIVFGSVTNIIPIGEYSVSITDSCGRTFTKNFSILFNPSVPAAVGANNGCLFNNGKIVVSIPSFKIVSAIITVAPAGFPFPLPYDASASIINGIVTLNPVPIGDYVIVVVDNCGSILSPLNCNVPAYVDLKLSLVSRPGCDLGKTSLELKSNNGKLVSASITVAPPGFPHLLPYSISNYIIASGVLYMDDLPGGNYTFEAIDECNFNNSISMNIPDYTITSSTFSLQPNCGSFNIPLYFVSNGNSSEAYWLQKLIDPVLNIWGHPLNNTLYVEGTTPTSSNSTALINNAINYNLSVNGVFRIVRSFNSYNDGISINNGSAAGPEKNCLEILSPTMSFFQALEILSISRISCTASGIPDVIVLANGAPPLNYSVTSTTGTVINNGNSNIFYNLPVGVYTFLIEDICGNQSNRVFEVTNLFSLVNMTQPINMVQCKSLITGNETFDITEQDSVILGVGQSLTNYSLNYFATLSDAQMNVNPILNPTVFNPSTNPQTIFARLNLTDLPNCYETRSFELIAGQTPFLNLQPNYINCDLSSIFLNASSNNFPTTTYLWSTGATTPIIEISQLGVSNLSVTATNSFGNPPQTCVNTKSIQVTISEPPKIDHFETIDWTINENSITIVASNNSNFEYSLDNSVYQDSPVFSNLTPGIYTVYVRDKIGCGYIYKEVFLLYYKKYFTPNGDGFNEYWRIENSEFEPELKVVVFDRYGKIMATFDSTSPGWDGTFNGRQELATDYWFQVFRQDGRLHRGHFALKR
jgi:gliding motility-associated-like protein